ncbi:BQ5605_C002g01237 [Microbotryum silenes-dioicae]|uniref:BQ5605_C002g01237 protein n=1 Tax=Microbotryum silenes-dioicae TaxID=796604 RepID=A0A2X0MT00_9BASI|nr:BQ5605_C002g01237 [Microbotryum silenes-dioicae]
MTSPVGSQQLQAAKLFNVSGRKALVTGGGSGLGEMMATALCQGGAHVYIASRKEGQLKAVADRLNREGPGKCEYIIADVGSKEGCLKLVAEVEKRTPVLHILVNNSGTTWGAPLLDFPEKEGWDRILATNVKAIYWLSAHLSPLLAKEATATMPGRIVNITSVAGLSPIAEGTGLSDASMVLHSYNTSKAAANSLTQSLAVSLGPKFITVNAIAPGVYPSKMTAHGLKNDKDNMLAGSQPMGRIGMPEDMAGLLLFLVSRAGSHTSGAVITTDGGALIAGRGYTKARQEASSKL